MTEASKTGRGAAAIALAKVYFVLAGFGVQFALPRLLGSPARYGLYQSVLAGVSIFNNVMIAATVFALIAYLVGNRVFADYLQLHYVPGTGELAVFCAALVGAALGFLWFNAPPAAVFMGDTGSLLIGLINAILVVKFINVANSSEVPYPIVAAPAIGFAILVIPLMDTLRVFAIRIVHRRSPFSPDRNHVHHLLLDKGLSHRSITLLLVSINFVFIIAAYICRQYGTTWVILSIVGLFFTGIAALYYTRPRARLFVAKAVETEPDLKSSKIVPLTKDTILEHKN